MNNLKIAIIGAGKVGSAFALDFKNKNLDVLAVIDKDLNKAKRLASLVKAEIFSSKFSDIPEQTNIFLIAVQDRFINEVANELEKAFHNFKNKFAFHTSGTLNSDELEPLKKKGCEVFSLHPNFSFVKTITGKEKLIKFNECFFAIESKSRKATLFAKKLCKRLNYNFIQIKSDEKVLYHIFSVLISNYTVTNFYQIEKIFGRKVFKSYLNLLKSTIQNIETYGIKNSLTGPIVRFDLPVIKKHLEMLSKVDSNLKEIYRKFGQMTVEMTKSNFDEKKIDSIKKLFR